MGQSVQDMLAEAGKLTAKKKYPQALAIYAGICKANPRDFKTWMKVGDLLCLTGDRPQAKAVYQRAARGLADSGQLLAAIAVNRKLLELEPGHTETQKRLAELYAARTQEVQREAEEQAALATALKKTSTPAGDEPMGGKTTEAALPGGAGSESPFTTHRLSAALPQESGESIEAVRQRLEDLPEIPLFSSFWPEQFEAAIPLLQFRDASAGEIVVREGEHGNSLFIIADGRARVSKLGADRKPVDLGVMEAGTFFGEIALFEGGMRSATVTAATDLTLLEMTRKAVDQLCSRFPNVKDVLDQFYFRRLLRTVLKFSPAFRDIPEAHLQALIGKFKHADVAAGQRILGKGAGVGGLIVIESGAVVEKSDLGARQMRGGDYIGLKAFLTAQPAQANYESAAPTRLYQLPRELYTTLIAKYPRIDQELRKLT